MTDQAPRPIPGLREMLANQEPAAPEVPKTPTERIEFLLNRLPDASDVMVERNVLRAVLADLASTKAKLAEVQRIATILDESDPLFRSKDKAAWDKGMAAYRAYREAAGAIRTALETQVDEPGEQA